MATQGLLRSNSKPLTLNSMNGLPKPPSSPAPRPFNPTPTLASFRQQVPAFRQLRAQAASAVAPPPARTSSPEPDGLAIVAADPQMAPFTDHLRYRWQQYKSTKASIEAGAGSLLQFAEGYKYFGFNRKDGATVYREWAPAAQAAALIGDFNGWQPWWMQRDQWGVWSISIPDGPNGEPGIPHGSRVKVRMQHPHGSWMDRVPAWIKWAKAEKKMGATYDGIYWDPPQKFQWQHQRPSKPAALRIYEVHVGMSGEEPKVATYTEFKDHVLPRIAKLGYNAVQMMAVQEHAYYGSFGYHVTNPFAVSSRSGTPDELKALVDEAHRMGIAVLLDVVHSHISSNVVDGLAGFDMGQAEGDNYFCAGERGYHKLWDSRCLNYRNWEVQRYLLSNLRWWMDEYQMDGFRFDGVTSMLYQHHGINTGFSGSYHEYFGTQTNTEACVYLMLANELIHLIHNEAVSIAEDVSGMPGLCRPVSEGGLGFDARLGMAIPDHWIKQLKHVRDENWSVRALVSALCNRRYSEATIGYAESHDQALVGDQTVAFRLLGPEMYDGMSTLKPASPVVDRGMALHKMIRLVTFALGGEGWLAFMGNEFGHPEWIDFPREGNNWSHHYCRRQWSLADQPHLRYAQLQAWDAAMMSLDDYYGLLSSRHQWVTHMDEEQQVLVAERGPLMFVFNFSPFKDYEGYRVAVPVAGKWRVAVDSDAFEYGGKGRVGHDADHFSEPIPAGTSKDRDHSILVLAPARTAVAYYNADTEGHWQTPRAAGAASKKYLTAADLASPAASMEASDVAVAVPAASPEQAQSK